MIFNLYRYLNECKKSNRPPMRDVMDVYQSRGWNHLDGIMSNVGSSKFPCITADVGCSGVIALEPGFCNKQHHSFNVLIQVSARDDERGDLDSVFETALSIGLKVLRMMSSESQMLNDKCYGFNDSGINYDRIGPVGTGCYGYSFSFTMTRDDEQE